MSLGSAPLGELTDLSLSPRSKAGDLLSRHALAIYPAAPMRLLFRLVGLLLLAGAFAALLVDGTRSVAAGSVSVLPFGRTLMTISPDGFQKTRMFVEAKLPTLWDPVLVTVFLMPTWVVFGVVGLVLLATTRTPAPMIGYSRR